MKKRIKKKNKKRIKKGQISIELLMMLAVSILILSILIRQVKAVEKIGERAIHLEEIKKTNETINSLCKTTALTNSKQEVEITLFKNLNLNVSNSFCQKKELKLKKGTNSIILKPGKEIEIEAKVL